MNLDILLPQLLQYSILFKVYHWQTKSYARHKASDELYSNVNEFMDELVEYYQGLHPTITVNEQCLSIYNITDKEARHVLIHFSELIESISIHDKGIINKRDELIGLIHQTLFLFKLK